MQNTRVLAIGVKYFLLFLSKVNIGKKYDQNDEYGKCRNRTTLEAPFSTSASISSADKSATLKPLTVNMCQYTLQYNNGAIDNNTKIYRSQTHKVGRNIKDTHQNECKQHG